MLRTDIDDAIADICARAEVSRTDAADLLWRDGIVTVHPDVFRTVLSVGIREMRRGGRADDRIRLKVLQLSPNHYEEMAARYRERCARPLTSSQRAAARVSAKREEARDRALEESRKLTAPIWRKVEMALAFYDSWRLSDGSALGDATRDHLLSEAANERTTAEGHERNVQFYTTLADRVPEGRTVRDAVDLSDAHRLRESVYSTPLVRVDP